MSVLTTNLVDMDWHCYIPIQYVLVSTIKMEGTILVYISTFQYKIGMLHHQEDSLFTEAQPLYKKAF